ncbi:MAG: hypothetical protein FJY83_02480 [Candidatus Aminicenantes bacterium]|nr:hypothetical protein [Candidatus Aminicenantes bacterium]
MFSSSGCARRREKRVFLNLRSNPARPEDAAEAIEIVNQVAAGLGEAHGKGIIHRDVKSANIMVTAKGRAQVLDRLGLGRRAGILSQGRRAQSQRRDRAGDVCPSPIDHGAWRRSPGSQRHDPVLPSIGCYRCYDGLHSEPRFQELLRKMRLPAI